MAMDSNRAKRPAELTGLVIALIVTTVIWYPPVISRFLPENLVWRNLAQQAVDWLFAGVLVGIVLLWERRPLSSLGFKPLTKDSFYTGLGLGGFFMLGLVVVHFLIRPVLLSLGSSPDGSPAELPDHFYFWYAPIAWITASLCEEIIYRGYAMERLLLVTGRPWVAVALPHAAFVLYHIKDGWTSVAALSVLG
jgi:membrane protease YdiL (CAAX protease family)